MDSAADEVPKYPSITSELVSDLDRSRFTFQHDWFEWHRPTWEELTSPIASTRLHVLEVGAFEGASTTWILDNLMSNSKSRMVVVDTFEGGMEHQAEPAKYHLISLEERFRLNVSKCKQSEKLTVRMARSVDALMVMRQESAVFDLIYIDASHVAVDVLHDALLSWRMLAVGGYLVFDDWRWKGYNEDCYNPRVAIIAFMQCVPQELRIVRETDGQIWVTKVPCRITPTKNADPDLYYWDENENPFASLWWTRPSSS
jgi:predicted O-methyltransferase YrrM